MVTAPSVAVEVASQELLKQKVSGFVDFVRHSSKIMYASFLPSTGGLYFFPSAVGGIYQVERLF